MTAAKFAAIRQGAISEVDILETHEEKLKGLDHDVRLQLSAINRLVSTNQTICTDGFETLNRKIDKLMEAMGVKP